MSIASRIAQLTRRSAAGGQGAGCADCPSVAFLYEDYPDQIQPQPTCKTCGRPVAQVVTICYVDGDVWRREQ